MIPDREDIRHEFKSDVDRLPDADLVAAVVCLSNTEGGVVFVGVENDGTVTGLHQSHRDVSALAAMIGNRTRPSVAVRVRGVEVDDLPVAIIEVPNSDRPVSTADGRYLRRRLQLDGTPECVPLLPEEIVSRQASFGHIDVSYQELAGAVASDLDPVERQRLRQMIDRFRGDTTLLGLTDDELDQALGLARSGEDGSLKPTLTGVLLIGTNDAIARLVPTHEIAYQVLDGTEVRVNDFMRGPLLRTLDRLLERMEDNIREQELNIGLLRVPIPSYDRRALREVLMNAVVHRDYSKLGPIRIAFNSSSLRVSNPGGFVEGVTLSNLLTVEPKPRNPKLADAFKRIGLVERTGRGVDLIFEGLIRYGRPAPDYSESDSSTVVVELASGEPDAHFLEMIVREEERTGVQLPIETLIVMASLRRHRRLQLADLARDMQRPARAARGSVEQLVETGLLAAHGEGATRTYTLSRDVLAELGEEGIEPLTAAGLREREQAVLTLLDERGRIRRADVIEACGISPRQASTLLARMVDERLLAPHGQKRGRYYTRRD